MFRCGEKIHNYNCPATPLESPDLFRLGPMAASEVRTEEKNVGTQKNRINAIRN